LWKVTEKEYMLAILTDPEFNKTLAEAESPAGESSLQ
jgi:hypothetical protein